MKPEVSVVVPCYKRPQFIDALMEGMFKQTLSNWELVFVDDGSDMPELTEICQRYERQDKRVKYIRQENAGIAAAKNRGIAETSAEFVAFHDDDDVARPQWLEKHAEFMQRKPNIAGSGCYHININKSGEIITEEYSRQVSGEVLFYDQLTSPVELDFNPIGAITFLRCDCLAAVGGFDEDFRMVEDVDLFLRLEEKYPLAILREKLFFPRRPVGVDQNFNPMMWQYFIFAYVAAYFRRIVKKPLPGDSPLHLLPYMKKLPNPIISALIFEQAKIDAKRLLRARRLEELGNMLRDFSVAFSFPMKYMDAKYRDEMRRYLIKCASIETCPSALPVIEKNLSTR